MEFQQPVKHTLWLCVWNIYMAPVTSPTGFWSNTLKPGAGFNSCLCLENAWKMHIYEKVHPGCCALCWSLMLHPRLPPQPSLLLWSDSERKWNTREGHYMKKAMSSIGHRLKHLWRALVHFMLTCCIKGLTLPQVKELKYLGLVHKWV